MAWSRRWFLMQGLGGTACAAASLWPGLALAQRARGPFGIDLPEEVQRLLPAEALDLAEIAENLLALEREAELRQLPHSALELLGSGALPQDFSQLYSAALPRLVALIDRATGGARRDGGFAERAGAVLARLHSSEHQVPETLRPHLETAAAAPVLFACQTPANPLLGQIAEAVVQAVPELAEPSPAETLTAEPPAPLPAPSRSTRFADLAEEYTAFFDALALRSERQETANWYLTMMRESRPRYERVSARTQVPWFFVGATHALEASFNFRGHLHNGDHPLSQRTRQVPANRPTQWLPPSDWESSAVDALRMMGFAGQEDWSLARTLHRLEAYNGFGYRRRQVPTPYLWSFSEHYDRGKFVADGRWSATARSQQCGAAVMLKLLAEAGDIAFG